MKGCIDLIIPAYNAHGTLFAALCSAAGQTCAERLRVLVVDDGSDRGYDDIAAAFAGRLSLRLLRSEKNLGPGAARQLGLDAADSPMAAFLDADDVFAVPWALETLQNALGENDAAAVGVFAEQTAGGLVSHRRDLVWMFGKLYRRSFLTAHGIRFHPTSRANEDNGFNTQLRLLCSEREPLRFVDDVVYLWRATPRSITRRDGGTYALGAGLRGYAENMEYALERARRHGADGAFCDLWSADVLCYLYVSYLQALARQPADAPGALDGCRRFYRRCFLPGEARLDKTALPAAYARTMAAAYRSGELAGLIPTLSFGGFRALLDGSGTFCENARERKNDGKSAVYL